MSFVIEDGVFINYVPEEGKTEVIVQEGVIEIAKEAFSHDVELKKVVLPESVRKIGDYAFHFCTRLSEVNIPSHLQELGAHAFDSCWELDGITLPESITELEDGTFRYCQKLRRVTLPDGLTKICQEAFEHTGLTEINIPDSVTSIGYCAFEDCSHLKEIIIPSGIEKIEFAAFRDCLSLEKVTLPSSVKIIDAQAFYRCINLTQINLPDNLAEIGEGAFFSCRSLKHMFLPESITKVGADIFTMCPQLELETYGDDDSPAWECILECERKRKVLAFSTPLTPPTTDNAYCPFTGECIAVYDAYNEEGVFWGDDEPEVGQVMNITVAHPFCCRIGNEFSATSRNDDKKFFTAKLLKVISLEAYSAEVRVLITASGDCMTFIRPSPAENIDTSQRCEVTVESELGGEITTEQVIYTDESGTKHLVKERYSRFGDTYCFFGDKIIGG